nr:MAG TPA: hypothetical protein [Caudoviricetes sp.]
MAKVLNAKKATDKTVGSKPKYLLNYNKKE